MLRYAASGFPQGHGCIASERRGGGADLGLMLTNANQLQTCTRWDTASLGLAAGRPTAARFDSRAANVCKTHIIWMAAARDMMVHSVLEDKVWTHYHTDASVFTQGTG